MRPTPKARVLNQLIRNNSTIKIISFLVFGALLLILNQNCSPISSTGHVVSSSQTQSLATSPLSCENESLLSQGANILESDLIKYYGRISHDISRFGYIDQNGKPMLLDSEVNDNGLVQIGANYFYKWFDFDAQLYFNNQLFSDKTYSNSFYCGVTDTDIVVCNQAVAPFEAIEISSLAGSEQVKAFSGLVCGLKNNIVSCYNPQSKVTAVLTTPEPIVLFGQDTLVGVSYKQYLASTNFLPWNSYPKPLSNTNLIYPYSNRELFFCSQNIKSASFPEFNNYVLDNGCTINQTGKLVCVETLVASNGAKKSVSILPDGKTTTSLASIDPNNSYVAIAAYSLPSTICESGSPGCRKVYVCGLKNDRSISCFNLKQGLPNPLKSNSLQTF